MAVATHHDVVGLNVAMNDSGAVCFFERAADLDREIENLGYLERRRGHPATQRDTIDELGGDVVAAVVNSDFVNSENVWMIEIRRCRSFLFESMESILVGSEFLAEDLDRDLATELHVFGKINHAHPAGAELLENSVMRDFFRIHYSQS
jgi:hypothetical protein